MSLYSNRLLQDRTLEASDGTLGHCCDLLLDDRDWTVRYLVIDTGSWLPGRQVVLSPLEIARQGPLGPEGHIRTRLSRRQVEDSPSLEEHAPISRLLESRMAAYYGWPAYWEGGGLWGETAALPTAPLPAGTDPDDPAESPEDLEKHHHLRSARELATYQNRAGDGDLGYIQEFLFDAEHWQTRFVVLKTARWFGGRSLAFPVHWIDRAEAAEKTVYTDRSREEICDCPEVETGQILDTAASERLAAAFA